MPTALKRPPAGMTVAEFLEWNPEDPTGRRWQLIDGEPVAMVTASENHGSIQSELAYLLTAHLIGRGSLRRVVITPGIVPRVRARENWRVPDLGVTCAAPQGRLATSEPILLVEIISPNNHTETRANIWTYTTLPSVQEILAVHSTRIEAELLRRRGDGTWPEQPDLFRVDEVMTLASLDLALPVRALYRTTSLLA
jgi:Uma2 family endonuclease